MKQTNSKPVLKRALITGGVLVVTLSALLVGMIACKDKTPDATTTVTTQKPGGPADPGMTLTASDYFSPQTTAVSADGKWLYVGGTTDEAIYQYSTADNSLQKVYETGAPVNTLTVSGDKVYAGVGKLGGKLLILSSDLKEEGSVTVGHTPNDVVISGTTAYVANRFSGTVSVVDLSAKKETKEIAVSREPMAMALVGTDLYVACHLPEDNALAESVSSRINVINTATGECKDSIALCNGAVNVKDIVATPDGSKLYVSHTVGRYTYPTTQLDGGWIYTNAVSLIDSATKKASYAFLLDNLEYGAGNPWGMTMDTEGKNLYIAISGSNELMKVDLTTLDALVAKVGKSDPNVRYLEEIVNYIPFATTCKTRIELGGEGVRSVTFANNKVYCGQYFSGDVAVVNVADAKMKLDGTMTPGKQPEANAIRAGEALWYDSTICYQNWQSCASCHPDGRADGLNWDNLNDGVGVSKQAKSMLYSLRTPPVMVTGIRPNGEAAIAAGLKYICFNADTEGIVENITAYLTAMLPEQSPYLNDDGTLTESATRGKKLFSDYGCVTCHPAPLYTDMLYHPSVDLESDPAWEYRDMDTSSLVEVWRTYPWGYIGGHTDMVEYVKNAITKSGKTISDADAADLANFVLSIGAEGEQYGAIQIKNKDGSYNKLVAGQNLTSLTVIKQAADAPNATVTLTLYDKNGKQLDTESHEIKNLAYGTYTEIKTDITVPADLAKGAYYVVSFKSGSTALATDLKIILN